MKNFHYRKAGILIVSLAAVAACVVQAGERERTTQDGVYTFIQALRGQSDYRASCASCHGDDMEGNGQWVPSLAGDSFMSRWSGHSLSELFRFIQSTMPQTAPHSLSAGTYIDIVAYVLSANGLPAGKVDLTPDMASLKAIRFAGGSGVSSRRDH